MKRSWDDILLETATLSNNFYDSPRGPQPVALLVPSFDTNQNDEFTTFTFDQIQPESISSKNLVNPYFCDRYEKRRKQRDIYSWSGNRHENSLVENNGQNVLREFQNPNRNLIKLLPSEILLDLMFYMDKYALFNFIQTCRGVYDLFDRVYGESIERLRIDILNKRRDIRNVNRLVDLFSNTVREPCWNESLVYHQDSNENVMMTYDQYFRMKSTVKWPVRYFHDHLKFRTFKVGDPMIDAINSQAIEEAKIFSNKEFEEIIKIQEEAIPVFPYGIFTQPDTYYLTFDELVKRRCSFMNFDKKPWYNVVSGLPKVDCVILPNMLEYSYEFNNRARDYHYYMDKETSPNATKCERIVRFFKNPYEMTFSDFQHRFKNEILKDYELARILFYECAFEHNKTTKTRERFVISGGSLLHTLTGCGFSDFDLFVINNGESAEVISQAIKQVLLKLEEKTSHLKYNMMSSKASINICQEGNANIQIVLLNYETIEELLLFFDLDCCKLVYDGERILTVLECLRSLKYKINFINRESGGTSEVHHERALKYGKRGFLTIVADSFHPLFHAMHCDFIVERIRKSLIDKYANRIQTEGIIMGNNPLVELFVKGNEGYIPDAYNSKDIDESNLLYPVVLKSVSFQFVEKCLTNGILFTVKEQSRRKCNQSLNFEPEQEAEAEADILKRLKLDEYEFMKRPSDLFQILPENQNLVKSKYSYGHLVCKFSIVRCQYCSTYFYSPFNSLLLRKQRIINDCNGHFIIQYLENKEITKDNFNPSTNTLCLSCLKRLNCYEKYQDAYLDYEYRNSNFVENLIETRIIQTIYKIKKKETTQKGISKERLFDLLSDEFPLSDLETNLKILKVKRLVIEQEGDSTTDLTLYPQLPIKTYSNKTVVPFKF
ncbi:hypothetical protein NAEGRDRAFT_60034 [Naegleria gruberi]|uniref:F-box domain-containing protein n=1 Tax=Naegleria gruberi TaxID=5762 RepID=D2W3R4_NAEGR|nr:uncharacterized protein NAEGRDRAFT_60034 [Naegleria gruberi]EFC36310.1 hypothetical protein NAEGRDRAFT_60034 [Naegleria gruberi]|eukprot:XP_002669054.1 hypothetical protein NAEGRDRAFT_60034 [Naegleria gruberi strain NEG-M]